MSLSEINMWYVPVSNKKINNSIKVKMKVLQWIYEYDKQRNRVYKKKEFIHKDKTGYYDEELVWRSYHYNRRHL